VPVVEIMVQVELVVQEVVDLVVTPELLVLLQHSPLDLVVEEEDLIVLQVATVVQAS
jgi:hypothetical protein